MNSRDRQSDRIRRSVGFSALLASGEPNRIGASASRSTSVLRDRLLAQMNTASAFRPHPQLDRRGGFAREKGAWLTSHRPLAAETRNYVALVTGWTAEEWASSSPPEKAETTIPQGVPCTRLANLILAPKQERQRIPRHGYLRSVPATGSRSVVQFRPPGMLDRRGWVRARKGTRSEIIRTQKTLVNHCLLSPLTHRHSATLARCYRFFSHTRNYVQNGGYQLAGSLLRPRRTNVCRQSGCSMSSMRRLGKRRSSVLIAISPSRRASCAPTQ